MLTPARLAFTATGTPWSEDYQDVYHSADGGPGQAEYVFLGGNALPQRWQGRERFVILELGFGTGLNFLATWAAWREDPQACTRLHYLSVEAHPFTAPDLARLHTLWPQFAPLAERLRVQWPMLTAGLHRLEFDGGRVVLTLMFGTAQALLPRLSARVDAFYLDGFDPRNNPELWRPELLRRLARLAAPGATLATWCVSGAVRAALAEAGFRVEKRPGYGRKRHMLAGVIERAASPTLQPSPSAAQRQALVVGAGLAGAAIGERLAARGWSVTLLERHGAPAQEASGNLAGIVRPLLSLDDNLASRFTRAAFLASLRAWGALDPAPRWAACGLLHLARDARHAEHQAAVVARHAYPPDYVRWLDRDEAAALAGWRLEQGGWFFPAGGWAQPASVCAALIKRGQARLAARYGVQVAAVRPGGPGWEALDAAGRVLAAAPVLVLADGCGGLWPQAAPPLPLRRVRGQVTHLPAAWLPPLKLALCREGYLTPPVDHWACVGATYDFDDDPQPRPEGHAANLARLRQMLPGAAAQLEPGGLDGRVGFRSVAPDRLPVVGAIAAGCPADREAQLEAFPRLPNAYALLALASRGLTWAWLAAELLASRIEGEPLPVETDLAAALDPARFLLRRLRRGGLS
ncbi:MAG: bifunctional tRNA (5-methylaminomethyl-2-thiouridine)(34)-methyltransferase MnmD/FAD-dependent 5-carboxymethylaminomethyl-2-thiouridine(34) oxidoreductase MnmC [Thiobacillaceae bacterium]|nr:bifunctional tRNA (5-methylaminomethyl-2-thiouridine)(34)-methyltransferase MnmD/FAD-dependent 5-carboxymethylaminomethyl-2-thiouridine(34) oxidoreductase MnmC [Thiobacillaceae bacterium]MDW8324340.1 bifunctional tRNA (5-methylaminomethyl-2-thiouridine)(34)-methyltransferase MnmD/FAD-dependent 5-carboxymethylaminomethyl-2-thiouridine(34) oxidoreductase MnmC [Burkholderiales bacterium]